MAHPGIDLICEFLDGSRLTTGTIAEQREAMAATASAAPPHEGVDVRPGRLGGRPAEWLTPAGADPGTVVLYLHGGGYCTGSLDSHRGVAGRIALAATCTVSTLDYRLAPEHPFPAAVDDAVAAYRELVGSGIRPERIALAGDSAGGGLTMAALLALRAEGAPLPAAAVCLSPWVDLTQSSASYVELADVDPMVTKSGLDEMAAAYLGDTDPRTPLASPLLADDLGGLPPVHIEVGTREVLLDDAARLAGRIRDAGGHATLSVWPELIHVFQAFPGPLVPEADESITAVGRFLAGRLVTRDAAATTRSDDIR